MRPRATITALAALSIIASACGSAQVPSTSTDTTTSKPVENVESSSSLAAVDLSGPQPVVVDYSPTVSDVGALMYLLAHPDVEVIAVSLPGTGEAGCDLGVEVTIGILEMFDMEEIPVACDPEIPGHARSWPAGFLEGSHNLADGLPDSSAEASEQSPSDLIASAVSAAGRPVVIYAVAPLTNVANALSEHPLLIDDVERIVIMGGAVNVAGNVEGTNAEWNVWIDVPAAAAVIGSGAPVTLVPLDATNDVPVPVWYQHALAEADQSDAIAYLSRMVTLFPAVTSGFYYLWDELAAAVAAGEDLATIEEMSITVVQGGPDDGRTGSGEGTIVTVASGVDDPDGFYAHFLSTLAGSPVEVSGGASPAEVEYFGAVEESFSAFFEAMVTIFSDPAFEDDAEFDAEVFAAGIDLILTGLAANLEIMRGIEPPASLQDVHNNYISKASEIIDAQDDLVMAVEAAASREEAEAVLDAVSFDDACVPLANAAALLGIVVEIPCG